MKKTLSIVVSFVIWLSICAKELPSHQMIICTATNNGYMGPLLNMIGGLHKNDFDRIKEIAVFDLGLSAQNKAKLTTIEKVKIYQIEKTHPDILKPFKTRKGGKPVPGWYAWKPVIVKQMLDKYPYVLWVDSGTTINKSLSDLFEHICYKGYFFLSAVGQKMKEHTTRHLREKFNLNHPKNKWVLDALGLQPGFAGYTRDIYDSIVLPIYELTKDLKNFEDDGSAPGGFGNARHDQSVISLFALLNNLKIHFSFRYKGKEIPLELPDGSAAPFAVKQDGHIWFSRTKPNLAYFSKFIRYKGEKK